MKRILLSAIVTILLVACSQPQTSKVVVPTRQGWHSTLPALLGDVESVTATEYLPILESGNIVKEFESRTEYKFNERGDVVEQISYDRDSSVLDKCLYSYNSEHRMTESSWIGFNGKPFFKTRYIYDNNGVLTQEVSYNGDGAMCNKSIFKYNSKGQKTEEISYDSKNVLQWRALLKYNAKGYLVEDAAYWVYGGLNYRYLYRYNSEGKLIEGIEEGEGAPTKRYTYKYDSKGCIAEKLIYSEDQPTALVLSYQYDLVGNVVKIASSSPSDIVTEYEIIYRE
jgi:hypothetical protein